MTKEIDKDAEIARLKEIIKASHFALLSCRSESSGRVNVQHFNTEKVRKAVALTEEIAVESAVDCLDSLLNNLSQKEKRLAPSLAVV